MKTGAMVTNVSHRQLRAEYRAHTAIERRVEARLWLSGRYCEPTGSGYCLSFQNIT